MVFLDFKESSSFSSSVIKRLWHLPCHAYLWKPSEGNLPLSKEHLATYFNDHLAGATFAVEILDHLSAENPDLRTPLAALRADIDEDREQLKALMAGLAIDESQVRKAGSWIAERVAEAKLVVDDDSNGPLRRLERLEVLALGIEGKIALWLALKAVAQSNSAVGSMDYEVFIRRGKEQRARVEALRIRAAIVALSLT